MKEKPDMVVAFAFGAFLAKDIFHSPNYWIARKAEMLAKKYNIPLVTQGDIAMFFEKNKTLKIFNVQENPEKYISTMQIALAAKRLVIQYGWKKAIVIVLAAPQHQKRCRRDLKMLGLATEYPKWEPPWIPYGGWCHPKSTQRWTRSPWLWWLREIPLRLMPWWLYKKIAT